MPRFVKIVLFISSLLFSKSFFSQDIRGAYIEYKWVSGYSYSMTTTLITDTATDINRGTINLYTMNLPLTSTTIIGKSKISKYSGTYTYPGPGYFHLTLQDSFRITGIKNIFNSQNTSIYLNSSFNISTSLGPNSCPKITNEPIYFNVSGTPSFTILGFLTRMEIVYLINLQIAKESH